MDRSDETARGGLEGQVMELVWKAGKPVGVREVLDGLNRDRAEPLAYTTVMTVMSRLAEKGSLRRRKQGRGYIYEPTAADPAGVAVNRVLRDHGDAAVAHFVEGARQDPEIRRRLERLLAELDG
jgi:predicted transcriptional regulator